ncbi:hypothetical protein SAMN05518672_103642 [Chitinophaga sp. CF118]|uniref:hypothetical protein n=1 Tax=Chitinophaga sp. CF118 TaxID=1884367 RepID=UPI0008EDB9C7|nr:hypothetical protein [Chitinophaga sp. CF118]SFD87640.1 hypothetical protein SAMN05518672_103642 [Chitinophaga sp. CF118]
MKLYKALEEKYTPEELAESYVFPDTSSKEEKEEKLTALKQHFEEVKSKYSDDDKLLFQLLQLKFLIQDYLKSDLFNKLYTFGFFLQEYITRINRKNKDFAAEIDIEPAELSQIINKHRSPSEKIMIRLGIHSNNNFPAHLWFKLLEKERVYELLHNDKLKEVESHHVKRKLEFSF